MLLQVFTKILHEPLQFADPSWQDISPTACDMISRFVDCNRSAPASG